MLSCNAFLNVLLYFCFCKKNKPQSLPKLFFFCIWKHINCSHATSSHSNHYSATFSTWIYCKNNNFFHLFHIYKIIPLINIILLFIHITIFQGWRMSVSSRAKILLNTREWKRKVHDHPSLLLSTVSDDFCSRAHAHSSALLFSNVFGTNKPKRKLYFPF